MSRVGFLLLTLSLFLATHSGHAINVQVQVDTSGEYELLVNGNTWLKSGDYAIRFNNQLYTSSNKTLVLKSTSKTQGSDKFGQFTQIQLTWGAEQILWYTSFKSYDSLPVILFTQDFPRGLEGTASGNNNDIISAFPTFQIEADSPLNYYTYWGHFYRLLRWKVGKKY